MGTRETFDCALRPLGFHVRTAGCAAEGIRIATSEHFDLLLVDLRLPDMPGTDMIRVLQDRGAPPARFMLISAFLTTHLTVEAMRLGALDVIEKPIWIDDLPALVKSALRQRSLAASTNVAWQGRGLGCSTAKGTAIPQIPDPRSLLERWVSYALRACDSTRDVKTLRHWCVCAAVSYTTLRECCEMAGVSPGDACDLVRVLRAVIRAPLEGGSVNVLLDAGDKRTRDRLLAQAGLDTTSTPSIDRFLERQRFVPADNAAVRLLRQVLTTSGSVH